MKIHSGKKPLAEDVDLNKIAFDTVGYSGADLESICNTAVMLAIKEHLALSKTVEEAKETTGDVRVSKNHFEEALKKVKPRSSAGNKFSI